jgi:RNA polymerase sigma-70 factor (ECF subfamily)
MVAADERQLVQRAQGGDHGAYRVLVERHMKQAYRLAFSFVNEHHSAEDVAQEAFVRAYRGLPGFRGEALFGTWLYRIVTNLSLNHLKQMRAAAEREVVMDEIPDHHPSSETPAARNELREHLEKALHELPTMQRAVVILRHLDGLSTKQVSEILNCSEGTVKTHLFRGLKRLKSSLAFVQEDLE